MTSSSNSNNENLFWRMYHNKYIRNYIFYHLRTMMIRIDSNGGSGYLENRIPFKYFIELDKLILKDQWSLLNYKLQCNDELLMDKQSITSFFKNCNSHSTIKLLIEKKSSELKQLLGQNTMDYIKSNQYFYNCTLFIYVNNHPSHVFQGHSKREIITNIRNDISFIIKYSINESHYKYITLLIQFLSQYCKLNTYTSKSNNEILFQDALNNSNPAPLSLLIQNNIKLLSNSNTFMLVLDYLIDKYPSESIIKKFIETNNLNQNSFQTNEVYSLLEKSIINSDYSICKLLVIHFELLSRIQDIQLSITSMIKLDTCILELLLNNENNNCKLNGSLTQFSNVFEVAFYSGESTSEKLTFIKLLLHSNIFKNCGWCFISFSMFTKLGFDESIQLELVKKNFVTGVSADIMEQYIEKNILRSKRFDMDYFDQEGEEFGSSFISKGLMVYINIHFPFKSLNLDSPIVKLYLLYMLENDNFEAIKLNIKKTYSMVVHQMFSLILGYYSKRPKLTRNLNSILSTGGFSTIVWFINNTPTQFIKLSIPLLPFQTNITEHTFSKYYNFSFSDKLIFFMVFVSSNSNIDSLIDSFSPFYGCLLNYDIINSLNFCLGFKPNHLKLSILKYYLYEKVIPNCITGEIIKIIGHASFQKLLKDGYSEVFCSSDYKKSVYSKLQSSVGNDKFNQFMYICLNNLQNVDNENVLELLFSTCLVKPKLKELIIKNDNLSSRLLQFVKNVQNNEEYYKELLKLSLLNHKFIFWCDLLVSPLSFTSLINNISTTKPNDESISNLFKSYKLNIEKENSFKIGRVISNNILIQDKNNGSGNFFNRCIRFNIGTNPSNSRFGSISKKNYNVKKINFEDFNNFFSIPSTLISLPETDKPIDIFGLIKSGQIYKAYEILVENNGNWVHFNFTNQDVLKIIEFDVIEQFSRFFNQHQNIVYSLKDCNYRNDVYEFLKTIKT